MKALISTGKRDEVVALAHVANVGEGGKETAEQ